MNTDQIKIGHEYYHYRVDPDAKGPPVEAGRSKVLAICPPEDGRVYVLISSELAPSLAECIYGSRSYIHRNSSIPASWIISEVPPEPLVIKIGEGPTVEELKDQVRSLEQEVMYYKSRPWYQFWK